MQEIGDAAISQFINREGRPRASFPLSIARFQRHRQEAATVCEAQRTSVKFSLAAYLPLLESQLIVKSFTPHTPRVVATMNGDVARLRGAAALVPQKFSSDKQTLHRTLCAESNSPATTLSLSMPKVLTAPYDDWREQGGMSRCR